MSRAHAVAPSLEAGQVGFQRPTEALQGELLSVPTGAHDDLVDAFCQGVIWLQQQHWRGRGRREPCRPRLRRAGGGPAGGGVGAGAMISTDS